MLIQFLGEKTIRIIYSIFLLLGILLVAWSITIVRSYKPQSDFYRTSRGRITKVEILSPNQYRIQVEFATETMTVVAAGGVLRSSSQPKLGERLLVHYNPYTPTEIELQSPPPFQPEFLFFLSILFGGIGFRFFVLLTLRNAKINVIMENGKRVEPSEFAVEATELSFLKFIKLPALFLHCSWSSPFKEEEKLEFYSEAYPVRLRDELSKARVQIYFLPQDPRRYFVQVAMK